MYRRYCKEDIEDIETNTSEDDRETWRERIRVYRRYRKEDIEDIETSTKMETAERHGGDGLECIDDIVQKTLRISRRIQSGDD